MQKNAHVFFLLGCWDGQWNLSAMETLMDQDDHHIHLLSSNSATLCFSLRMISICHFPHSPENFCGFFLRIYLGILH